MYVTLHLYVGGPAASAKVYTKPCIERWVWNTTEQVSAKKKTSYGINEAWKLKYKVKRNTADGKSMNRKSVPWCYHVSQLSLHSGDICLTIKRIWIYIVPRHYINPGRCLPIINISQWKSREDSFLPFEPFYEASSDTGTNLKFTGHRLIKKKKII